MPDSSNGIVQGNPVNNPDVQRVRTRSRFGLTAANFGTYRFGEYGVHFLFDGVPDDKRVTLHSRHDIRSYTMKAPLMSDVKINKDYFLVYMDAILPRQWDRIYNNPTVGDDVDPEATNCVVPELEAKLKAITGRLYTWTTSSGLTDPVYIERRIKSLLILEHFFSTGSLLASMGANFHALYCKSDGSNFDDVFNSWFASFRESLQYIDIVGDGIASTPIRVYVNTPIPKNNTTRGLTLEQFLDYARTSFNWSVTGQAYVTGKSLPASPISSSDVFTVTHDDPFNFARPLAYQLSCAQYFTNDRVDYVYEAELYRQAINALWIDAGLPSVIGSTFSWNGLDLEYDILSGHYLAGFIGKFADGTFTDWNLFGEFCNTVLQFRRSLRFVDYFTGARPFPLAVGDSGVQVANNKVNVIDVIRTSQAARFRNAVMRAGRRTKDYLSEIMGASQRPDYHNPFWIGRTTDSIGTQETENTSDLQFQLQNGVSSVLRSASSRYAFELDVDRSCIIVGVTSFDIPRSYYRGVDKFFRKVDRFDYFNPFMQYTGDQPIQRSERDIAESDGTFSFGYQQSYMEYKQAIPTAFGGFVKSLPGWTFLADEVLSGYASVTISPDFIRSSPSELDKFFVSLNGLSLGTRFHFIIKNVNDCAASRPMAYNPQLM